MSVLVQAASLDGVVVVVGAGRSGTTMMREALASHPDLAACDYEMNYVWRYGNSRLRHDMLSPKEHFAAEKSRYIREQLLKALEQSGKPRLVEKTVANVVRIPYVYAVLPEARFVHVVRDGRAVAASAMERWQSPLSTSYLASKARTIPWRDVPRVGLRYIQNRVLGRLHRRSYTQSWGPRWPEIDRDVKSLSLAELCAKQWAVCVDAALRAKEELPLDDYLEVRYEDICTDPTTQFRRIAQFVDISPDEPAFRNHIESKILNASVNKWRNVLRPDELAVIENEIGGHLQQLGYA